MLNRTGGTFSHSGMIDYPRLQISELHLGKFPGTTEYFKAGKSISRLKYVQNQRFLTSRCTGSKKLR